MSERTLQRHITEEGTTFRELLNNTRHKLVREGPRGESVEITEAAFLLGYEDPNSFYRAFRAWEDRTPAEWQAAGEPRLEDIPSCTLRRLACGVISKLQNGCVFLNTTKAIDLS